MARLIWRNWPDEDTADDFVIRRISDDSVCLRPAEYRGRQTRIVRGSYGKVVSPKIGVREATVVLLKENCNASVLYEQASKLTEEVVRAAVMVQKHFGIGALESIYVRCLERELQLAGHTTSREGKVTISYRGLNFDENLRYDLLVDNCLLVEAKACEKENMEVWRMQLLTYMKLTDKPLGLVVNFGNESFPRRGLKRVILKGADEEPVPF